MEIIEKDERKKNPSYSRDPWKQKKTNPNPYILSQFPQYEDTGIKHRDLIRRAHVF